MKITINLPDTANAAVHFDAPDSLVVDVTMLAPVAPPDAEPSQPSDDSPTPEQLAALLATIGYAARVPEASTIEFAQTCAAVTGGTTSPATIAAIKEEFYAVWSAFAGNVGTLGEFLVDTRCPTDNECFAILAVIS